MLFLTLMLKLVFGLIALLVTVRLLGKKTLSQATSFDLVYMLVLGGILAQSIYDTRVTLFHLISAIAVWGLMVYGIQVVVRQKEHARTTIKGSPAMLFVDGKMQVQSFIDTNMEVEQFRSLLREQNIFCLENVELAILETSGRLSVITKGEPIQKLSYLLVNTGEYVEKDLGQLQDKEETRKVLQEAGYDNVRDIFCALWSSEYGLYLVPYPESEHKKNPAE
ncbi:DUF421 domain-containing protein [Saccharibacillus kuerlensis]|uniref:DUF421 domain-containing protein n=1 Tax=Saccharibacillus kuerlensis TaxID=459527 RepID=A0ABQ2L4N1_9BACL|nr:YetF domain-containing protein [Saccharibacillus kuerlensis]GGO02558.1 DUF421 domain-containing protein [Saccharibacillus kuerlensis]